jgi:hypothetical protein
MNTQTKLPHYMLLFRGNDWYKGLSPEEMQKVASQWMAWFERLTAQGKAIAGSPLEKEGKVVSGKNGRIVSDGPFAESKETVGGYFLLRVDTLDEATTIAQECPGLPFGIRVEVRPVAEVCPMAGEALADNHRFQLARGVNKTPVLVAPPAVPSERVLRASLIPQAIYSDFIRNPLQNTDAQNVTSCGYHCH